MLTKKYKDIIELLLKKLGDNLFKNRKKTSLNHNIINSPSNISKNKLPLSANSISVEKDIETKVQNDENNIDLKKESISNDKSYSSIEKVDTSLNSKTSIDLARIDLPIQKYKKYVQEDKVLNH